MLIADDEPDILEILKYNLSNEGYEVFTAKDGDEALEKARRTQPDLIILDVMMPKKTGVEVCQLLRSQAIFKETLIIFLTAVNDEGTQIKGLETGADDYISKPISPKVFLTRVNALFRRLNKSDSRVITLENMTIDPERFIVKVGDTDVILAKKEFELLYLLALKPGRVFLRNEILNQVWGNEVIVGDRTIDVHKLRELSYEFRGNLLKCSATSRSSKLTTRNLHLCFPRKIFLHDSSQLLQHWCWRCR